jgi:ubiquitin C-terminal hydrolase
MSISLPLSKGPQQASTDSTVGPSPPLSVEQCLRQFTSPEVLADPVDCPSCREKTATTKQHVISKLPKILVLHLKRFNFTENRKIEDYVAFPAHSLNMGPYLPHWRELPRVPIKPGGPPHAFVSDPAALTPRILYNLQSTVNHYGSLQSGHYYANVRIDDTWFHCNDAHVSYAQEGEVVAQPAYMLFYARC